MKNIKTFMMTSATAAALCLSSAAAQADYNSYSRSNDQQLEYRTPADEMNQNNRNQIRSRDYHHQGAQYNTDQRPYRADRVDNTNSNIRWGSTAHQQRNNLSAGQLQLVQRRLRDAGHSISVDGVWGPETASAVREFQQERNLSVTGRLDTNTLSELNISTTNTRDIR